MARVTIELDDAEVAALRRFTEQHAIPGPPLTGAQAARILLRDALIGIGLLPLGRANRGPGARAQR